MSTPIQVLSRQSPMRRSITILFIQTTLLILTGFTAAFLLRNHPIPARVGDRARYSVRYESKAESDLSVLLAGAHRGNGVSYARSSDPEQMAIDTALTGELTTTLVEIQSAQTVEAVTLANPSLRLYMNGQDVGEQKKTLESELAQRFFVERDGSGRITGVRFARTVSRTARGYLGKLVAAMQFATPATNGQPFSQEWTIQQEEPTGNCEMRYRVEANGSVTRACLRQIPLPSATQKNSPAVISPVQITPEGTLTIQFDRQRGKVLSVNGTQNWRMCAEAGESIGYAQDTLAIRHQEFSTASEKEIAVLKADLNREREEVPQAPSLSAPPTEAEEDAILAKQSVGDATVDSLLTALHESDKTAPTADHSDLQRQLGAFLSLHPSESARMGEAILKQGDLRRTGAQLLTAALCRVGHTEGQAVLAGALRSRNQAGDAVGIEQTLPLLAMTRTPTETTEEVIRELSVRGCNDMVRDMGRLCLGVLANKLAIAAPERSARLVQELTGQLKTTRDREVTVTLLGALGNAATPEAFATIRPYTKSQVVPLRAAAIAALHRMPSPEVATILCSALMDDREAAVRGKAIFTLGARPATPETIAAQRKALAKEPAGELRIALMQNLAAQAGQDPEVVRLLREIAIFDKSEPVRKVALSLVTQ